MKRTHILFLPFFSLALIVAFLLWFKSASSPVSGDASLKDFLIVRGLSGSQIGEKLYKEGLIKSSLAFKIYIQLTGKANKIQAGEYQLSQNFNLFKIVDELVKGPAEIWVTIPEGLRREEIALRYSEALGTGEEFRKEFLEASQGMEGYLFPDTYLFAKTASASAIVRKMRRTFDLKIEGMKAEIEAGSLSLEEVVTLASIVERESKFDEERPIIAGILINRLNIGMGLQADATVQYAVANANCRARKECNWWPTVLTKDELKINSPYNTYRFKGLPPGPIANPGLSSIKAAILPKTSNYLYYLHDDGGVAHYAETLEEHNQNIRIYLGK